ADLDVGEPGPVRQPEQVAEQIDLPIAVGPPRAGIDLLHQHEVGVVVGDRLDHALGLVAPVHAADALVDVVAEDPDLHAWVTFASTRVTSSSCRTPPRCAPVAATIAAWTPCGSS